MIRALERLAVDIVLLAAGTWLAGWWSVPLVAAGLALARAAAPWRIGLAAFVAWAALLGWLGPTEARAALAGRLAAMLGAPASVPGLAPPLYAGLLAWSAAGVCRALPLRRKRESLG